MNIKDDVMIIKKDILSFTSSKIPIPIKITDIEYAKLFINEYDIYNGTKAIFYQIENNKCILLISKI
jgi:hypothetical protein